MSNDQSPDWSDVLKEANRQLRLVEHRRKRLLAAIRIFRLRVKQSAQLPASRS